MIVASRLFDPLDRCAARLLIASFLAVISVAAWSPPAAAHEIDAAIADVTLDGDRVAFEMDLVLEAYLAEIDLEAHTNTQESSEASRYDILRSLPPEEITAAFGRFWPTFADRVTVLDGEARAPLTLDAVSVPPVGDVARARISTIRFSAPARGAVRVGWDPQYGALVLRQQGLPPGEGYTGFLVGGALSAPIEARSGVDLLISYLFVGFERIAPYGPQHILFALAIYFFSTRPGPLAAQLSAFGLALAAGAALGVFGQVRPSPELLGAVVAISIVLLAVDNLLSQGRSGWRRPLMVFVFGLAHGLALAAAFEGSGAPSSGVASALSGFMLGAAFALLAAVAVAYLTVGAWFGSAPWWRRFVAAPASVAIAAFAVYLVAASALV